jgi:hypothetical protein
MKHVMIGAIGSLLLAGFFGGSAALADTFYWNNTGSASDLMDAEVVDYNDWGGPLDGMGDEEFPTYNDAVLGHPDDPDCKAEFRSMVEYNISGFTVPPGQTITAATFNIRVSSSSVFMGCGSVTYEDHPLYIAVHGYVGNGTVTLDDFQRGCITPLNCSNYLNRYDLPLPPDPPPAPGTVISFDVTDYVTARVNAHDAYVGLMIRAGGAPGGMMFEEWSGRVYPQLVIETAPIDPCQGIPLGDFAAPPGVDGIDIQYFVDALLATSPTQDQICHGDFNDNGVLDIGDVNGMVAALLSP